MPAGGWGTRVSSGPTRINFCCSMGGLFPPFFFLWGAYFSMWGLLTSFSSLYLPCICVETFLLFFSLWGQFGPFWGAFIWSCPLSTKLSADAHVAIQFPPISKACANTYFELYAASFLWSHLDLRITITQVF